MLTQIRVKQVTIEGTTIIPKSCCLLMKERLSLPNFLWVEEILVSANEKLFFCGRIIETRYYSEHFHCYVVRETEEKAVISDLDERHVQPLHLRYLHSLDSTVIVPKHNIYEE